MKCTLAETNYFISPSKGTPYVTASSHQLYDWRCNVAIYRNDDNDSKSSCLTWSAEVEMFRSAKIECQDGTLLNVIWVECTKTYERDNLSCLFKKLILLKSNNLWAKLLSWNLYRYFVILTILFGKMIFFFDSVSWLLLVC